MTDDGTKRFEYLSIHGNSLLLPLFHLVWKLLKVSAQSTPAKANARENAWAVSAIALAAIVLESWLVRVQWDASKGVSKERHPLKFYNTLRAQHPELPDVTELFVARDLIFHNHLYLVVGSYGPRDEFVSARRIQGGDSKFAKSLDIDRHATRQLGINVIPTRITRRDVGIYVGQIVRCFEALIDLKLLMPHALNECEAFGDNGERHTLQWLAEELSKSTVPVASSQS